MRTTTLRSAHVRCRQTLHHRQHHSGERQQQPAQHQPLRPLAVGQQPSMTHLHEATRQHVLHPAPQELFCRQCHHLPSPVRCVILRRETYCSLVTTQRTMVRQRHPMCVQCPVLQHLLRPST